MIRVNVEAMHILCKEVLRQMQVKGKGTILNVASSAGLLPGGPYMATYYATKAYVVSLTKSIAEEQREKKAVFMSARSVRDLSIQSLMRGRMLFLPCPVSRQTSV